ncbi:MAG: UvrD-helicase domain-containing protein [Ignavibacteriae bacterium]|nr:UvrD-helicase domain-containing protein [Ignavibacteriota bacterium]
MHAILEHDSTLALPNLTLVTASAGSGKTHTLTLRYLQLLLSTKIPFNNLKNILAMTFTNNAASEMKQRILAYLKYTILHPEKEEVKQLSEVLSLDRETLQTRAAFRLNEILDNYSDFQVQTIDSFITRLLRVSALELGFSPDFQIVFDSKAILDDAFDVLFRDLSFDTRKQQLVERVIQLVSEAQDGKSKYLWDPFQKLTKEVGEVHQRLSAFASLPLIEEQQETFRQLQAEIIEKIISIGRVADTPGVIVSKNYQRIMATAGEGDVERLLGWKLGQKVLNKSSHPQLAKIEAEIARLQDELALIVGNYFEAKARAYYVPFVQTHLQLLNAIEQVKRLRGEVHLGDANKLLAGRLRNEIVPEVYFTLGERIHHFLIDEFQDTAPIQWAVLRPLIEESLAKLGSLFIVGDTKQSIYTFRGADWQIMARMLKRDEFRSVATQRKELTTNWRSTEAIVGFAKKVFHEIIPAQGLGDVAKLSGLVSFEQNVYEKGKGKGYVEVFKFEVPDEEPLETESPEREKLLSVLQDCIRRGYRYCDIAILTPKNNDVVEVSRWLNESNIKFLSHSSLDIRTRTLTGELLALLRWLDSPVDDLSFASFLFGDIFRKTMERGFFEEDFHSFVHSCREEDARAPLYSSFKQSYSDLWEHYFDELFTLVGYLPVYDLVVELYRVFRLFEVFHEEEAALVKFLEVIKKFEETGNNNLKDFLEYAEENDADASWDLEKSSGEDAVTIMTVHKAKGLGFPIVIALLYDSRPKPNTMAITTGDDGVRLIRSTKHWSESSELLGAIYNEDAVKRNVDELNKLYVMLTRAREEMYVLSVQSKYATEPSSFLPENGFSLGSPMKREKKVEEKVHEASLLHQPSQGLKQATSIENIHPEDTTRGEIIHAVLSNIIVVDERLDAIIARSLDALQQQGYQIIDKETIAKHIKEFLAVKEVKEYFTPKQGRTIFTEQEIVGANGQLHRMDRLILDSDRVTVLDFKTGAEKESYIKQVQNYLFMVRQLYPKRKIEGALAYVDVKCVRRIA